MPRPAIWCARRESRRARPRPWRRATAMPSGSATLRASFASTCARLSTTRWRTAGTSTFDSSNWKAAMMCSFSAGLWLFQNRRGLAEVIVEARAAAADLGRLERLGITLEALLSAVDAELGAAGQRVRLVGDLAPCSTSMRCMPSRWKLWNGQTPRLIGSSWKLAPPSRDSCVSVYENSRPCSSGSLLKSMPGTTWPGMEGHLFGFGKEVVGIAVQHQLAHREHRHHLLRNQLGRVQQVEAQALGLAFLDQLQAQLPFGKVAVLDRLPQVAPVKVGILAGDLLRLVPHQRVLAQLGLPVELDEVRNTLGIDEAEGVDAEAFHHAVAARDGAVRHDPHQHVRASRA